MTVLVVNGPNLSQLGTREPEVYGSQTLDEVVAHAREVCPDLEAFQSEDEGAIVARLHAARTDGTTALIINPGALTHYSYALRDALDMLEIPKVEVHLSQTHRREPFRRHSVVSPVVDVTITGAGALGYRLAAEVVRARLGS